MCLSSLLGFISRFTSRSAIALSLLVSIVGCLINPNAGYSADSSKGDLTTARHLISKRQYRAALDILKVLIKDHPTQAAYTSRGRCYAALAQYPEAISDFKNSLALDQNDQKTRWYLADALHANGNVKEELSELNLLLTKSPQDLKYLKARAKAHAVAKRYKESIADFTSSLKIKPESHGILKDRAKVYAIMDKHKLAVSDYTHAISIEPDLPNTYYDRGCSYLKLADYELAVRDFSKVIELSEKERTAGALLKRAEAYEKLGKLKEAAEDRKKASQIDDFAL